MEPSNVDATHPLDARSSRLKDDLRDARRKIDDLEHQVTRHREDFERQTIDLKRQAANFERDIQDARQERESFRHLAEQKDLEAAQLREKNTELERVRKEYAERQQDVERFRDRCDAQEKELKELQAANAELKAGMSAARNKVVEEERRQKSKPDQGAKQDAQTPAARNDPVIELSSDDDESAIQVRAQYPLSSGPHGRTDIAQCSSSTNVSGSKKPTEGAPSTVLSTPDQRGSMRTGFVPLTPLPTPSASNQQQAGASSKKRRFPSMDPAPVKVNTKRPRLEDTSDNRDKRLAEQRLPQPEDIIQMRKPEGQENRSPNEDSSPSRSRKGKEKETNGQSSLDAAGNNAREKNPSVEKNLRPRQSVVGSSSTKSFAATNKKSFNARKAVRKDTPILYMPTYIKDVPGTLNARVASYDSLKTEFPAPPTLASTSPQRYPGYVHRHFLSSQYGACPQTWLAQIAPARNVPRRERRIVFSQWANNPGLPTRPGAPGTIIANRLEILEKPPWSIFVRAPTESLWQYRGEYIASLSDTPISGKEFQALPATVRVQWAKDILRPQKWRCYTSMRARIWLRKMGFPLDDETVETTIRQNRRTCLPSLREEDVLRALGNGEEELNVLLLKPVGYDTDFQADMQAKYVQWLRGNKKVKTAAHRSIEPASLPNDRAAGKNIAGGINPPASPEAGPSTRQASISSSDRVLRQPGQGGKPMNFEESFGGDLTDLSEGDLDDGSDYTELD